MVYIVQSRIFVQKQIDGKLNFLKKHDKVIIYLRQALLVSIHHDYS